MEKNSIFSVDFIKNRVKSRKIIGILLIFLGLSIFLLFTYWMIISKLVYINKMTEIQNFNSIHKFLIEDKIVCLAVPSIVFYSLIFSYFRNITRNYFIRCF